MNTSNISSSSSAHKVRDFFLHAFQFASLYAVVVAFMTIGYRMINIALYDFDSYYQLEAWMNSIKTSSAILFVLFPAFLVAAWLASKYAQVDSGSRRFFVYLTMFAAAATAAIDLIVFVYRFYDGDLPTVFLLKSLFTLLVPLSVGFYYLRNNREPSELRTKLYLMSAIVLVLAALVGGYILVNNDNFLTRIENEKKQYYPDYPGNYPKSRPAF